MALGDVGNKLKGYEHFLVVLEGQHLCGNADSTSEDLAKNRKNRKEWRK